MRIQCNKSEISSVKSKKKNCQIRGFFLFLKGCEHTNIPDNLPEFLFL